MSQFLSLDSINVDCLLRTDGKGKTFVWLLCASARDMGKIFNICFTREERNKAWNFFELRGIFLDQFNTTYWNGLYQFLIRTLVILEEFFPLWPYGEFGEPKMTQIISQVLNHLLTIQQAWGWKIAHWKGDSSIGDMLGIKLFWGKDKFGLGDGFLQLSLASKLMLIALLVIVKVLLVSSPGIGILVLSLLFFFFEHLEVSPIFIVELTAMWRAIYFSQRLHFTNIWLESDCLIATEMF